MKFHKLIWILFIAPTLLLAKDETHVDVGSRASGEETVQVETVETEENVAAGYIFDNYPPIYYSSSHHWLAAIAIADNNQYTLELEDGSVWKINGYDADKALNWKATDPLAITQNTRWFSRHTYRIINKANGTSLEANLFLGPIELGQYSRFITGIDYSTKTVLLSDNTHWQVSHLDTSTFGKWALNDYIIIGTNSNTSCWDLGSDALLINVNMNNSARAKQY